MTIDDFDLNQISDKLAIREETEPSPTLRADTQHEDAHNDAGCAPHDDTVNGPFHDDHTCGHDDGHYDLEHDDSCFQVFYCPSHDDHS